MAISDDLNPEQRQAVLHRDGPLLILAGAGSGKTRVIAHRVAHLIEEEHAAPHQILAVTFTNKAAGEMRERVERLLGSPQPRLWLATFHAFCARVLRREAPLVGVSRAFVIYDAADQLAVVRRVMRELGVGEHTTSPRAVRARISDAKNRMLDAGQLRAAGSTFRDEQLAQVFERYGAALAAANALDFDDLLLKALALFELLNRDDERVPGDALPSVKWARSRYAYRHVLVDEYQDTNAPQYKLLQELVALQKRLGLTPHGNLCVVGDPDQSIYAWRGADIRNILDFETDFPNAAEVRLERNYRSTRMILDAASGLISRNRDRKDKRLWTEGGAGDPIVHHRAEDELEEADFVAARVRRALGDGTTPAAVLYRTNAQSRAIEDALVREGIRYRVVGGVRFYERKEVKDALAFLKLLLTPDDDVSLRRVINTPPRGIGKGVMDALDRMGPGAAAPSSLWARIVRAVDERMVPPRAAGALARFRDLLAALTEIARTESASVTLEKMLDRTGYVQALRDAGTEEAESRLANLLELVAAARDYELCEPEASLAGFVDQVSLRSEADEEAGADGAQVWLMTLHAAKGLEFPIVFITGMEDGLLPHVRALHDGGVERGGARRRDPDPLEEERRLLYVGITRAQSQLVLTGAARRRTYGTYQDTEPSCFLDEIPAELLESAAAPGGGARRTAEFRRGRRPIRPRTHQDEAGARPAPPVFDDADEDQSAGYARPGMRVRHPTFGVGTVTAVEPQSGDVKLTVRFHAAGTRKLLGRYARLEPA